MVHETPGIPFSPETIASRRSRKIAFICWTGASSPVSAAIPARCTKVATHENVLLLKSVTVSAIAFGAMQ